MTIEVNEVTYKGFKLVHMENGWKVDLEDSAIAFPHLQAAQSAINTFYDEVVPAHKGKQIK